MKNPLKRKKKTATEDAGLEMDRVVIDLPAVILKKGGLDFHIDDKGARPIQAPPPEADVIESLGRPVSISYDPQFRGSFSWGLVFGVDYSVRGQTFGVDGPDLVRHMGALEIPAHEFKINDDGRITVFFQERPKPALVAEIVRNVQAQVTELMEEYGRIQKIAQYKRSKKA